MNDTPTPRTDAEHAQFPMGGFTLDFARRLERELTAANEYADKLAAGLPDGMLPKDVEVLREANLGLAVELTAVTEQRDRIAEALERILEYQGRFAEEDPESIAKEALKSLAPNK